MAYTYTFNNSSNAIYPLNPVDLDINIYPPPGKKIKLKGRFSIDNIKSIVNADNWTKLKCELYGMKEGDQKPMILATFPVRLPVDKISVTLNPDILPIEFNYITVKLSKATCYWGSDKPGIDLQIVFFDVNNPENIADLLFPLVKRSELQIVSFTADPLIVQGSTETNLSAAIKSGNAFTYSIINSRGDIILAEQSGVGNVVVNAKGYVAIGDYQFTLVVKQNDVTSKANVIVRGLGASICTRLESYLPNNLIINLCAAVDSSALFALIINNTEKKIDSIGYCSDGFSGRWTKIGLTPKDQDALTPFAYAPMVHLKDVGEVLGRLLFIGGSKVNAMTCSNKIAIIDLEKNTDQDKNLVKITDACRWPSRMGHSCVIFPHGGKDKIWLLGGQDEYGTTMNDIWVSDNGNTWDRINANGSVVPGGQTDVPMDWQPRCCFGAAVQLDANGRQGLWIGGGFAEDGGRETRDIWMWARERTNWMKLINTNGDNIQISSVPYLSSALAFAGKETIDATGIYVFGAPRDTSEKPSYFGKIVAKIDKHDITRKNDALEELSTTRKSNIVTVFFKGCIWYLVYTNNGDDGISVSSLYYWVPPKSTSTIIL